MNPIFKNILAVILGIVIGSAVNMGIIMISGRIITPPNGVNVTTVEGLKEAIYLFQPKHFIFPFLAHALGTLVGAFITALIAINHQMKYALGIGVFFLIGGIVNILMLPSPAWFATLDLAGAYIPMALLGWKIAQKINK